ncbi:MAG: hypothetical protein HC804_06980 [Anaerolineae bacterium]|nr:hypothetical protein [Anaerolineae bacterium]
MKALTVRQPWAWAIINAGKDNENRNWHTNFRGRVFIHAAIGMTHDEYEWAVEEIRDKTRVIKVPHTPIKLPVLIARWGLFSSHDVEIPTYNQLIRGAIIGAVEIINCVQESDSPWFEGKYGFVLARPEPLLEPLPCKGALGFWNIPENVEFQIRGEKPLDYPPACP